MTEIEEKAETFSTLLKQLGYTKVQTGAWVEEIVDDGQGFPKTIYHCPFCKTESMVAMNYCAECGARLNDETD
jgi:hypothetical protein